MSLPSQSVASGPLPSATFSGWDAQTEQLAIWATATTSGGAAGPADAIQFSDGAGNFQGTANATVSSAGALGCQSLATVGLCAVGGNATVAGTLNTTGAATIGPTGNAALNAGTATVGSVVSAGGISALSVQIAQNGRYTNAAVINQAPGAVGMSGTRSYSVACAAATNNIDIGLNALINDSVPHLFSVSVRTNDAPGTAFACLGLVQSFPAINATAPSVQFSSTGNGYAFTSVSGTPGAYNLGLNNGIAANTALVNISIIY